MCCENVVIRIVQHVDAAAAETVLCACQDEVDKKLAALFEELAIWEGYLSKVYLFVDVS